MNSDTAKRSGVTYYGDTPYRTCAYWRLLGGGVKGQSGTFACHYAIIEKQTRGCEPGEKCVCRKTKVRKRKSWHGTEVEVTAHDS